MVQTKNVKTGELRNFNDVQWGLMGKALEDGSKKGWQPVANQTATPVTTDAKPITGTKEAAKTSKKDYALYEERLAKLIAIDEKFADMDLATMSEEKFNEMLETLTKHKADAAAGALEDGKKDTGLSTDLKKEGVDNKESFLATATEKNLSKNIIKDYFDKDEVKQEYANNANLKTLINQLGEYLGWSIEKLNENF